MSVSFGWKPSGVSRGFSAGTFDDHEKLRQVFGDFPLTLGPEALPILHAMGIAAPTWNENTNIYQQIERRIEKSGEIIITANW